MIEEKKDNYIDKHKNSNDISKKRANGSNDNLT
jgi:hypothetical protein